ncbi:beta-1,4-galactosyltransferase 1-like [Thalassophryne amazonica]|uniref:beta-1,4-galactosyltransferase 1-like n=1 Tax=Thalassophryne amazonica TaxID=390379 RepID=UPI0014719064|nr:beta-1,4-galactosyltransferase 1-like [Thalassophryne amazonica]XP_034038154.1 beta-1,4-galactosyltransferase 1-like [Thalassophryne amazonica]
MSETHSSFHLLNRTCMVVALLCFLHMCIALVFYIRSIDIRFTFVQNQQSNNGSASWIDNISSNATNHNQIGLSIQDDKPVEMNKDQPKDQQDDLQASPVHPEKDSGGTMSKHLEKCPETSPLLVGPIWVEFNIPISLEDIKKHNPNVMMGGRYRPKDCMALQKVAIIIPFRNRNEHLKYWLHYLHPILQRQQLDYGIFIINQDGDGAFNRAKLLNIGYAEAQKQYDYDCFVFSDVDIIPMDDRNLYQCFGQPRHMSVLIDKLGFRLPYPQIFGGVTSMNKEQFQMVNGYSNNYWGWGGEDDDLYQRFTSKGLTLSRPASNIGKCRMFKHDRDKNNEPNAERFNLLRYTKQNMVKDGLNSLSYKVIKTEEKDLFTIITADVENPRTST